MENASKALLIAAGVLLMMLTLSFAVYLFRTVSGQASSIYGELSDTEIDEFNQKFFNFENKKELTMQDVVSIINLAKDNNKSGKYPVTVKVLLNGKEVQDNTQENINTDLQNSNSSTKYKCTVEYATKSKLVGEVKITTLNNN